MSNDKIATDFLDAVVDRLAERLMPDILERLASQLPSATDRKITIEQAALEYPISEKTLYRLCQTKQIPHVPMGAQGSRRPKIILSSLSLDAWFREQERKNFRPA